LVLATKTNQKLLKVMDSIRHNLTLLDTGYSTPVKSRDVDITNLRLLREVFPLHDDSVLLEALQCTNNLTEACTILFDKTLETPKKEESLLSPSVQQSQQEASSPPLQ